MNNKKKKETEEYETRMRAKEKKRMGKEGRKQSRVQLKYVHFGIIEGCYVHMSEKVTRDHRKREEDSEVTVTTWYARDKKEREIEIREGNERYKVVEGRYYDQRRPPGRRGRMRLCVAVSLNTSQKRKVSSPAPVTIVEPSWFMDM